MLLEQNYNLDVSQKTSLAEQVFWIASRLLDANQFLSGMLSAQE